MTTAGFGCRYRIDMPDPSPRVTFVTLTDPDTGTTTVLWPARDHLYSVVAAAKKLGWECSVGDAPALPEKHRPPLDTLPE